jgi:HEAT repeat protein
MAGESVNWESGKTSSPLQQLQQKEQVLAAIILLLGPDTDYQKRIRASQQLAHMGADILPLLLHTLDLYPAITTPAWPWWPPQYEQISRLLISLSQNACIDLAEFLRAPNLTQPPGPVLWTSVIEAAGLLPHMEYETLLRDGLQAPWWSVRYAAATALANRATHVSLAPEIRQALYQSQHTDPEISVRLVASCTLLRCADNSGLEALMHLLEVPAPHEVRKATIFILATELSVPLEPERKETLAHLLLRALQESDPSIALNAARALRNVMDTSTLPDLKRLLDHVCPHVRVAALTAFEELACRKTMRAAIQQHPIPQSIASLLHAQEFEVRRQACYTLATLGGDYATAVLGALVLDDLHPAHREAIEALRLLPDLQQPAILDRVMHWLFHALAQPVEMIEICALDSLNYVIWQARARHRHAMLHTISEALRQSGSIFQLLASASAWVRQRTVELLSLLDSQLYDQRVTLLEMLHHDIDSGVRACIAYTLGQASALWALPDLLLALLDWDEYVAETALNVLGSLPLHDDTLLIYSVKELAAYHLPLWKLHERRHLAHLARAWLKKRGKGHYPGI